MCEGNSKYSITYTVESPKTDTPRSRQPLYNGQTSWNGIKLNHPHACDCGFTYLVL